MKRAREEEEGPVGAEPVFVHYVALFPELKAMVRRHAKEASSLSDRVALAMTCRDEYATGAVILPPAWRRTWNQYETEGGSTFMKDKVRRRALRAFRDAFLFTRGLPECTSGTYLTGWSVQLKSRRWGRWTWKWGSDPFFELSYDTGPTGWHIVDHAGLVEIASELIFFSPDKMDAWLEEVRKFRPDAPVTPPPS
jgi:hypothetical protein